MKRMLIPLALTVLLSGCGLAETASTTATIAESEAEQAKQAQQMKAKIEQGIDAAQQTAAQQRQAAEAASE
jgi:outer membrane lipoprotein-sorting protein